MKNSAFSAGRSQQKTNGAPWADISCKSGALLPVPEVVVPPEDDGHS